MDVSRQITDISYMQNVSATVDYAGVEKILNDFFYESLGSENSCLFELAASLFARHQYDAVIYYLKDDICADDLQRTISLIQAYDLLKVYDIYRYYACDEDESDFSAAVDFILHNASKESLICLYRQINNEYSFNESVNERLFDDDLLDDPEARAEAEYEELEQLLLCAHKHFGCAKKILKENLGLNKLLVVLFDTRLRFVRSYARTYFNFFNESPEDLAYDSIIDFKSKESYWQFVDEYENELFSYLEHNEFSRAAAVYECLN